jgi:transposase
MNETTRNEIIHRWGQGASQRSIAQALGISRGAVARAVAQQQAARSADDPTNRAHRSPRLDPFEEALQQWLTRYPEITVVRLLEELRAAGYQGGYTILRQRVQQLRGRQVQLVRRFETAPGVQAQMDWGVYTLDFTDEGRRRVNLFSYVLGYSRRQYLRFTESQDLATLLREHVRAFEHLGGAAATCLYDNQKAVVDRWEDDEPLYNTRFLAFATHYGFRPWACRPRRPQTKGKVERPFHYVETSLLNGRTFRSLEHLNELTAWWLETVADVRLHRELQKTPREAHAEERPYLLPPPERPYDTALVVYRVVDAEGYIGYERNGYSVPWQLVGQMLAIRVGECELIVYDSQFREIARHALWPRDQKGQRRTEPAHRPSEARPAQEDLRQRFVALGEIAERFHDGLLRHQAQARNHARKTLALLGLYRQADVLAAMERAVRYGAFSWQALERILAVTAKPKPTQETLAADYQLPPCDDPIGPRSTAEYQRLLGDDTAAPALPDEVPHESGSAPREKSQPAVRSPEDGGSADSAAAS